MKTNNFMTSNPALRTGFLFGVPLGILIASQLLLGDFIDLGDTFNNLVGKGIVVVFFGVCLVAGLVGRQLTGRVETGIWAGLVTSFVSVLIFNLFRIFLATAFFNIMESARRPG